MTDSRSGENNLRELEFNDLNIHLYLTLNYGTASEHLDFDLMVLYNVFVLPWGLTITHNSTRTISDLDRSGLTDTRSAENASIGADTDPKYRIDASLAFRLKYCFKATTMLLSTASLSAETDTTPNPFPVSGAIWTCCFLSKPVSLLTHSERVGACVWLGVF